MEQRIVTVQRHSSGGWRVDVSREQAQRPFVVIVFNEEDAYRIAAIFGTNPISRQKLWP